MPPLPHRESRSSHVASLRSHSIRSQGSPPTLASTYAPYRRWFRVMSPVANLRSPRNALDEKTSPISPIQGVPPCVWLGGTATAAARLGGGMGGGCEINDASAVTQIGDRLPSIFLLLHAERNFILTNLLRQDARAWMVPPPTDGLMSNAGLSRQLSPSRKNPWFFQWSSSFDTKTLSATLLNRSRNCCRSPPVSRSTVSARSSYVTWSWP